MFRIGHGYDVHRLVESRKLILGGVQIPFELGLLGHSDADVLTHSLMDAMLGAAALGDIGKHFPDNEEKYKGADSLVLLKKVNQILQNAGYKLVNADATLILQKPKVKDFINKMRENLSETLCVDIDCVSVKATTEEGLGFTGTMEGIACHSVVLIEKI
ncbi:MAG: 2-C-methyl-D-erythritol 2,4-cyclodiphosphate synthase [Bacillota bacterium]|nr:2-C-methyl-D-erythritol 2,4-cyclodiphosphate synthase [Bacillota bacterium]